MFCFVSGQLFKQNKVVLILSVCFALFLDNFSLHGIIFTVSLHRKDVHSGDIFYLVKSVCFALFLDNFSLHEIIFTVSLHRKEVHSGDISYLIKSVCFALFLDNFILHGIILTVSLHRKSLCVLLCFWKIGKISRLDFVCLSCWLTRHGLSNKRVGYNKRIG